MGERGYIFEDGGNAIRSSQLEIGAHMPSDVCAQVLEGLRQSEIFRAAKVCKAFRNAASATWLFKRVNLGVVGRTVTSSGRSRWLSQDAVVATISHFILQPRFVKAVELDLSGLYLGNDPPEECPLLHLAALRCPWVSTLRLNDQEPRHLWVDLRRCLSSAFERSLLQLWRARPFRLQAYGRCYQLG